MLPLPEAEMVLKPAFCTRCGSGLETREVEGRPREVCPACGYISYRNPLPVAAAVVLNERREVLLVKRRHEPQQGLWCLPIGFAELDETIAEAALRELQEETGIQGRILGLLDVTSLKSDFYGDLLIVTFEAERIGGEERAGDDATEVGYYPPGRLPALAFPSHERAIQACLAAHREEWAMRDSFATLESERPEVLLSDALVGLIRERAEEIAGLYLEDATTNPTTPSYRGFPRETLLGSARTVLLQLGRWLQGEQAAPEIRRFYRRLGAERKRQGIPLQEILSSFMLLKKHAWTFARDLGVLAHPIDLYRVMELDRRLVLFFDRAMYHAACGYAMQ